jgi:hypothetical protein
VHRKRYESLVSGMRRIVSRMINVFKEDIENNTINPRGTQIKNMRRQRIN